MVIVVVERCDVQVKLGSYKASVPGFVTEQVFRGELSVANDAKEGQRIGHEQRSELEVFFDAGGRAHGASNGAPDGLPWTRCPQEPGGRLDLEAAIAVMQKLRAEG